MRRLLSHVRAVLMPFVVNPFGGLGPIANKFLFGPHPEPPPLPLTFSSLVLDLKKLTTMLPPLQPQMAFAPC